MTLPLRRGFAVKPLRCWPPLVASPHGAVRRETITMCARRRRLRRWVARSSANGSPSGSASGRIEDKGAPGNLGAGSGAVRRSTTIRSPHLDGITHLYNKGLSDSRPPLQSRSPLGAGVVRRASQPSAKIRSS